MTRSGFGVFPRHLRPAIEDALADTPAVMLVGARQTGKTTLARLLAEARAGTGYVTLDDATALEARGTTGRLPGWPAGGGRRRRGPAGAGTAPGHEGRHRPRAPARPLPAHWLGRRALAPPRGGVARRRVEVATLWPLSQGELAGRREHFVDAVLRGERPTSGGAPATSWSESSGVATPRRRCATAGSPAAFFDAYVTTLVQRDVRDLADVEHPGALRRLLQLASVRTASVLNHSELGRTLGLPVSTLKRYLAILETLFLAHQVPAWASNRGKRLVRASKLHVADSAWPRRLPVWTSRRWSATARSWVRSSSRSWPPS